MDYYSLVTVCMILVFAVLIRATQVFARESVNPTPVRSRYDLLESEVARLQAENAQLAVKAAKTEYR